MKRILLIGLLLLASPAADAHEIGTTQVRLTLHGDHTWSAAITTAPQALVNKLEVEARLPRSSDLGDAALRARLGELSTVLARHVEVAFDGSPSPVSIAIARLELPSDVTLPAFVVLLANGPMPPEAHAVTWRYDLAYATYSLEFAAGETGSPSSVWLEGDEASPAFPVSGDIKPPTRVAIIGQYLSLGFLHIVPHGLDHILFVLGLFLLTTKLRPILVQVTSFTIAHSVTLGLTMYGIVAVSASIVEPLIALSVAYVAIENITTSRLTPWRPAVVFAFGLLHGMGFADALKELHLPREAFVPALISFNLGIELAQLAVIAAAFLAVAAWHREKSWYRPRFVVPGSAAIAATGLFWTAQRIAGF